MSVDEICRAFVEIDGNRPDLFTEMARTVFAYQREENPVYGRFCGDVVWRDWKSAPSLPVRAFKDLTLTTFPPEEAEQAFRSSATRSVGRSVHYVRKLDVYCRSIEVHFESVFGRGPFTMIGHLPRYADIGSDSSLVFMVEHLIQRYGDACSGFFLDDRTLLERAAGFSRDSGSTLILFGAAFGLVDLVEEAPVALPSKSIVIETGGMKTHRRQIDRKSLHRILSDGFSLPRNQVFSEYGMCEMLSQCYTRGDETFLPPAWVRFRIVDPLRPTNELPAGQPGALAVFDLANLYTVSALLTEDLAVSRGRGFEVLGRLSEADLRGCNFLLEAV